MSRILLVGVDLFLRGKLESLLPGHHLVTHEEAGEPALVIADVGRVDPAEVVASHPGVPLLGFTNHRDTEALQRAHAAGFDRVVVKSALFKRTVDLIESLLTPVKSPP